MSTRLFCLLAAVAAATGCHSTLTAPPENRSPQVSEAPPADYVPARSFATTKDVLEQLHSVVEGTVENIRFDMDDCWGPRTVLTLANVRTVVGGAHSPGIELYTFGGLLPGGSYVEVSELPLYVLGGRYLLFLRNTDWRYSPVIGDYAYRFERIAGKETLISSSGRGVTGFTDEGIETNTGALTGPVGYHVKGLPASYRNALKDAMSRSDRKCNGQSPGDVGCRESAASLSTVASDAEGARRRLLLTQRFARPAILEGVDERSVASAIDPSELLRQLEQRLTKTGVRPGGRFFDRPRYGCWGSTPTVKERSPHVDIFTR